MTATSAEPWAGKVSVMFMSSGILRLTMESSGLSMRFGLRSTAATSLSEGRCVMNWTILMPIGPRPICTTRSGVVMGELVGKNCC